jgi:hypothetical protein
VREEAALSSPSRIQAILHLVTTSEWHFFQSVIARLTIKSTTAFSVVRNPRKSRLATNTKATLVQGRVSDSRDEEQKWCRGREVDRTSANSI